MPPASRRATDAVIAAPVAADTITREGSRTGQGLKGTTTRK
jgi:hypothetical protein